MRDDRSPLELGHDTRGANRWLKTAAVFGAGLCFGAALHPFPSFGSDETTADGEVQPVRGIDRSTDPASLHAVVGPAAPAASPPSAVGPTPSARNVARTALGFTAFIQAKDVYGAGVLVDDAGHVLTCRHVVSEAPGAVQVTFSGEAPIPARVIEMDADLDLALLEIPKREHAMTRAEVGTVEAGDEIYAMGAPRKLRFSVSRGMVSFVGRHFSGAYYLQTDLPANSGSSGGPVMNERGEVVAITSFVLKDTEGLAFALPIDYAYARFASVLQPTGSATSAFSAWRAAMVATNAAPVR